MCDGNCACLRNIEIDLERGSLLGKGIPCSSYTKGQSRRELIQGSQNNLSCDARERFGPTYVPSVSKRYLEEH